MTPMVINVGISQAFHNKSLIKGYDKQAYGNSFVPTQVNLGDLIQHITAGGAFTMGAFQNERRVKDNFVSSQMVALDLDDNVSVQDCLANSFIVDHAVFIGATSSSGKLDDDGQPIAKTRVLFLLDTAITDRVQWERLQRALIWHFEDLHPDAGCKDCTRLFYGSDNPDYVFNPEKQLSISIVETLASEMDASEAAPTEERTVEDNSRILIRNKSNQNNNRVMTSAQRYADVALDNMVSELSSMAQGGGRYGGRNNTLYRFSAAMGNMIAARMIDRGAVENALRSAAQSAGMDQRETATTLYRAIREGETTPFDLSRFEIKGKPERPEPIVIDEQHKDERDSAQAIRDEVMALDIAYEAGQRVSWINQDHLPISIVSAVLNLSSARSSLPAVFVKLHYAFRNGTLKPYFTIDEAVKATGYSRKLISNVLKTLHEMTFVHFLEGVSLDTLPLTETTHKGRPSNYYMVNFDSNDIRQCLYKMLEKKSRVQTVKRALSDADPDFALELGMDDDDFEIFKNRMSLAQAEDHNADAVRAYKRAINGNGHEWKGWHAALNNTYAIPLDVDNFENCKDLRVQVALWWIEHVRDINSREDWERVLGCSNGTIDSVFAQANIKTIQQTEKLEFDAPSNVKAMETLYIQTQREYRGKIWKISYKVEGEEGWQESSEFSYKRDFVRYLGKVDKVFMILTTPSKQVPMDEAEIKAIEAETEEQQAIPENILQPDFMQDVETTVGPDEKEEKPRRITVVSHEHVYTTYPYAWKFIQAQLYTHAFTNYKLSNDGTVLDADDQLVRRRSELGDLFKWLNKNSSDSQLRTVASFFGEDFSDEDEMRLLQKIERIHFFETNYTEYYGPALFNVALLEWIANQIEAGAMDEQEVLAPTQNKVTHPNIDVTKWADFNRDKDSKSRESRFAFTRGA